MFAYNGGPGSASIWLHMGILGPQRAVATDADFSPAGPYLHVDNEYSIIDEVDLVMIDPVGTGFSRPVGEGKGEDFWGVDQDIKSVAAAVWPGTCSRNTTSDSTVWFWYRPSWKWRPVFRA